VHKFGDANFGLENLSSLEHVTVKIKLDSSTPKEVEAVVDEIQKAVDMNPGKPTSIIKRETKQVNILAASLFQARHAS
jgi:hypothetical protein